MRTKLPSITVLIQNLLERLWWFCSSFWSHLYRNIQAIKNCHPVSLFFIFIYYINTIFDENITIQKLYLILYLINECEDGITKDFDSNKPPMLLFVYIFVKLFFCLLFTYLQCFVNWFESRLDTFAGQSISGSIRSMDLIIYIIRNNYQVND